MCYRTSLKLYANALENEFRVKVSFEVPEGEFNGFTFPETAVILNSDPDKVDLASWGLMPHWAKQDFKRANTLNARIETIAEKPSFRSYAGNRCLVPVTSFFEWQWLDEKGKEKQKYEISTGGKVFAMGGIYAERNGVITYSIVTTEANELMAEIHNTKKRMPLVLTPENREYWLQGGALEDFKHCDPYLEAKAV